MTKYLIKWEKWQKHLSGGINYSWAEIYNNNMQNKYAPQTTYSSYLITFEVCLGFFPSL